MTNKLIEKMAEAIWIADHADTDTWEGGNRFEKLAFIGMAKAAHACIPQVTGRYLVDIVERGTFRVMKEHYDHPLIDDGSGSYILDTSAPKVLKYQLGHPLGQQTAIDAVKVILDAYPNGFWVDD